MLACRRTELSCWRTLASSARRVAGSPILVRCGHSALTWPNCDPGPGLVGGGAGAAEVLVDGAPGHELAVEPEVICAPLSGWAAATPASASSSWWPNSTSGCWQKTGRCCARSPWTQAATTNESPQREQCPATGGHNVPRHHRVRFRGLEPALSSTSGRGNRQLDSLRTFSPILHCGASVDKPGMGRVS